MSYVFVSPSSGDYVNALAHYEKGITGNNKVSVCMCVKWWSTTLKEILIQKWQISYHLHI